MRILADALVGLVAAAHLYFLVLEMFLWQGPRGRALSGFDADTARATAPLAANQGLYNGFLAAGLAWGLVSGGPAGHRVEAFFLYCALVAGVYGGLTANRRILLAQGVPAAVALATVLAVY